MKKGTLNEDLVCTTQNSSKIYVKDPNNRVLRFLNEKRPRRRYLYFWFLISYLNLKRHEVMNAAQKIEQQILKSTLVTLARYISGCEAPRDLVKGTTFNRGDKAPGNEEYTTTASSIMRTKPGSALINFLPTWKWPSTMRQNSNLIERQL